MHDGVVLDLLGRVFAAAGGGESLDGLPLEGDAAADTLLLADEHGFVFRYDDEGMPVVHSIDPSNGAVIAPTPAREDAAC